jgi:predicted ATPase
MTVLDYLRDSASTGKSKETTLIVIEDIHWADEATMDFIKFLPGISKFPASLSLLIATRN